MNKQLKKALHLAVS